MLNFTPVNPLISKCQIKVCYVGEEPNRNGSIITKEVAKQIGASLPGSPIVGFYNEQTGDFEEHNKVIDISNGRFDIKDTTSAYGFVSMDAPVWFQKFMDDGVEHEYLLTEGYLWTSVFPETKRILENGNNQSMELDEHSLKGSWTTDENNFPEFFIINEALISKLCILGENVEPCFEGARIAAQFSFDDNFKQNLFSKIEELKTIISKGGFAQMDEENKVVNPADEESPAVLPDEDTEFKKKKEDEDEAAEDEKKEEPKDDDKSASDSDDKADAEEAEEDDDEKKKKKKYSLDEIPEYAELAVKYAQLEKDYETLKNEVAPLREFKANAEKAEKQAMIDSFYMLSDEDKADCVQHIDEYSLDDIEAKLAIICVRNKVSFSLDDDKTDDSQKMNYNLNNEDDNSDSAPAWIKAVRATAKDMQ